MQDVTPASKLAAKAAEAKTAIPETPVREAARTPKKSVTPFHDEQVKKESPCKNTPKTNKTQEHDEVPPSLEKKRSGYRSFMAREGPRALGSKSIPQVKKQLLPAVNNHVVHCCCEPTQENKISTFSFHLSIRQI